MDIGSCLAGAPLILTGGSLYERLRRDPTVTFDPDIAYASFVYDEADGAVLEQAQCEYLDVALAHDLPMLVTACTWRASWERLSRSAFSGKPVNQDNIAATRALVDRHAGPSAPLFVAGVLGPAGDAYRPDEAPDADQAASFHAPQVEALVDGQPDFLLAATLPALPEARGIARLLDDAGLPYMMSFVVRDDGTLLDGTALTEALDRIDGERERPPAAYMINCVHPTVLSRCLDAAGPAVAGRILGLRANTSTLRPEDVDGSEELITQPPEELAQHMVDAQTRHALRLVGGCCGTGTAHLDAIARRCKAAS